MRVSLAKLRSQLDGAGGGVDLAVEGFKPAVGEFLVAGAVEGGGGQRGALCMRCAIAGNSSSGTVNSTLIGCTWVMTTRPLASPGVT